MRQWGFYAGDQWRVESERDADLRRPHRRADVSRRSRPRTRRGRTLRLRDRRGAEPGAVRAARRLQLGVSGNGTEQIRGGVGLFTGRPAYVWISNQFGNTGIDFTRIGATFNTNNRIPFVADPLNQPTTVTGAAAGSFTNEIDVIDPDFKYPSILRGNVGYDRQLWGGFTGTFDFVCLEDDQGHRVREPELRAESGGDRRRRPAVLRAPVHDAERRHPARRTRARATPGTLAAEVQPAVQQRVLLNGSYSYGAGEVGHGRHVGPGGVELGQRLYARAIRTTSPLARSNFDPGHRITLTATYEMPFAGW